MSAKPATLPLDEGVVERAPSLLPAVQTEGPAAVLALMAQAVQKGMAVDTMETLQAMYHKEQDREAARQFADAMATFQQECPAIPKTSKAKITSKRTGSSFSYTYAELDQIAETVKPHLHKLGMSFAWDCEVNDKLVKATCVLRHRNGHAASASFQCPTDPEAAMNVQQQYGAALTFAKRMSLIQVLGITTADEDTDAAAPATMSRIGPDNIANIAALMDEVGADRVKFLKWLGVAALSDITEADYPRAVKALEEKRKKA